MNKISIDEAKQIVTKMVSNLLNCPEMDGQGQIVIYTGIFFGKDGNLYDEPNEFTRDTI